MLHKRESRGQVPADGVQVGLVQQGDLGGPEIEGLRVILRKPENGLDVAPRMGGGHGFAGQVGVFLEGALDVHGKDVHQPGVQQPGHNVGAHAVGIHLDRQADGAQVGQQPGQPGDQGGLAAGDGQPVQPHPPPGEEIHRLAAIQGLEALGPPGQAVVVAGGAAQIAAAGEQDAHGPARPVAQAQPFHSPHITPSTQMIRHDPALPLTLSPPPGRSKHTHRRMPDPGLRPGSPEPTKRRFAPARQDRRGEIQ